MMSAADELMTLASRSSHRATGRVVLTSTDRADDVIPDPRLKTRGRVVARESDTLCT